MLKKAATVTAIAASFMLAGAPAYAIAGDEGHHDHKPSHHHHNNDDDKPSNWLLVDEDTEVEEEENQVGLVNLNDSQVLSNLNVLCNVNVLGSGLISIIPIASGNAAGDCTNVSFNQDGPDNDD